MEDKDLLIYLEENKIQTFTFDEAVEYMYFNTKDIKIVRDHLDSLVEEGNLIITNKKKYMQPKTKGYYKGIVFAHEKGFAFVSIEGRKDDVFVPNRDLNGALNGDTVLVSFKAVPGKKNVEGKVVSIIKRKISSFIGSIIYLKGKKYFVPKDPKIVGRYKIDGSTSDYRKDTNYLCKIVKYPNINEMGVVQVSFQVETVEDEINVLIEESLDAYEIIREFSPEALEESEKIDQEVKIEADPLRRDLRETFMVTIDGADAKDFDDAISLEMLENGNFLLGVHIADVSEYVKMGSPLDKDAFLRGTSTYIPGRVIPMLPFPISNGVCSLQSNVLRHAMTCMMEIGQDGLVKNYEIFPSYISVNERMIYDEVAQCLLGQHKDDPQLSKYYDNSDFLLRALEIRDALLAKRVKRGSILFDVPEIKVAVDEVGNPQEIILRERNDAESLIEEMMLIANETVAEHLFWLEVPNLYRVHEEPLKDDITKFNNTMKPFDIKIQTSADGTISPKRYQQILEEIEDHVEKDIIVNLLLRSMQHARYDVNPLGHFGLNAKYYSHFTSPIRRYPDLMTHRMLKEVIYKGVDKIEKTRLLGACNKAADKASKREILSEKCERDIVNLKTCQFMKDKVGEEFAGFVVGMIKSGIFIRLSNYAEGFLPFATMDVYLNFVETEMKVKNNNGDVMFTIGTKVRVTVSKVDISARHIDLKFEEYIND